ncbi:MAG: hypothetical protein RIB65_05955 [Ilumatobacter fluminis]|uniref:TraR/DksA family transcriptional regulator n=1 Tax=Ilumatobacter fluminis TaxID=467091 RepID=UPI0032EE303A
MAAKKKPATKAAAKKKAPAKKPAAKKAAATKAAAKKAPAKKAAAKKAAAKKSAAKKAPAKKAAAKKAPAKKAAAKKQAAAKKAPAKKAAPAKKNAAAKKAAPAKKARATKATSTSTKASAPKKSPATKTTAATKKPSTSKKSTTTTSTPKTDGAKKAAEEASAVQDLPKPRFNKDGFGYTKDFDLSFVKEMYDLLQEERVSLTGQVKRLEDEAHQLVEEAEMGDVQFDDEGGEGDTMVVERERDLALSAQAREAVEEIDAAIERIMQGTYGYSTVSGKPIPRERLEAIPWSSVLVEEKVGGIGRR